jgi:hypothetical protein
LARSVKERAENDGDRERRSRDEGLVILDERISSYRPLVSCQTRSDGASGSTTQYDGQPARP